MLVAVHAVLTGEAATVGGVRYQQGDTAVILLARDISVDEQADLLAELTDPDDRLDFSTPLIRVAPTQRSTPLLEVRVAG